MNIFVPFGDRVSLRTNTGIVHMEPADLQGYWVLPSARAAGVLCVNESPVVRVNLEELSQFEPQVNCVQAMLAREVTSLHPVGVTDRFYSTDRQVALFARLANVSCDLPLFTVWECEENILDIVFTNITARKPPAYSCRFASGIALGDPPPYGHGRVELITVLGRSLAMLEFSISQSRRPEYEGELEVSRSLSLDTRL
ncbi:MAG: hypothetical protein ACM3XM_17075 [Mycobacterium leprae]